MVRHGLFVNLQAETGVSRQHYLQHASAAQQVAEGERWSNCADDLRRVALPSVSCVTPEWWERGVSVVCGCGSGSVWA